MKSSRPPVATSPEAHAIASLAAFRNVYRRACRCHDRTDLREESTGIECLCGARLVAVAAERTA